MEDYGAASDSIPYEPLTERETEILVLIASGASNREIADSLFIAHSTVRWYIRQIYSKLGAANRQEAIALATQMGLKTAETEGGPVTRHNLPVQSDSFIGRERELNALIGLLADPNLRLITILGPGGMGKTRLALKLAEQLVFPPHPLRGEHADALSFPDGVFFVPLAPALDLTVATIAEYSGYRFQQDGREPKQQLFDYLRQKKMLLVLDNIEHLLDKIDVVSEILEHARNIHILVTSRLRLNLKAETIYMVDGMAFDNEGSAQEAVDCDTARLFLQSARRIKPDIEIASDEIDDLLHICRLVDGMPLAIELAAAWVELLSLKEIASEITQNIDFLTTTMHDIPIRQHSIRAVFDYAWKRLSGAEQNALMRLAIFRGGWSREAATVVADADLPLLRVLVNKSLIHQAGDGRYDMHMLMRQFAEAQLEATGDVLKVRVPHSRYFADRVYQLNPLLRGVQQTDTLNIIEQDLENIRAGWQLAVEREMIDMIGQYISSLYFFFDMRSRASEGIDFFGLAANFLRQGTPAGNRKVLLGQVLARQGSLVQRLGHYREAQPILEISLDILREVDKQEEIAFVLNNLADIARATGQIRLGQQLCEESLAIFRALGDEWSVAGTLNNLGVARYLLEEFSEADQYYRESLALSRRLGDLHGVGISLINLGTIAHDQERYDDARHFYEDSLLLCEELDDLYGIAASLNNLGRTAFMHGDYAGGKQHCEESLDLYSQFGDQWGVAASLINLGDIVCSLGDLQSARQHFHQALKTVYAIRAVPLIVEILVGMAVLLIQEGKDEQALALLIPVNQNPPRDREIRTRADHLWSHLQGSLSDEQVAVIQSNYQHQPIETFAEQILAL